MANKLSSIFVLLLILIIALITYWLKIEVEKELLIKNNNNASGPEFYLKSFNSIQTKKNGDVKFILSAKNMEQFDYAEYAILKKPHFTRYKDSKPYSFILPNMDIVLTKKPVKIIQEPNIEIYGIGMKYDNKEGIVKLLSNVKVHYGSPRKNEKIN